MMVADATVLVVDDEPELLEIFSIWLRRYGAAVLQAANGVEALNILTTHTVDALISDMRMPVMDGLSLVRHLHDRNLPLPTVIFVSAFGDVSPRVLYALGAEAMLSKPLARHQLIDTLKTSLRERDERWLEPLPEPPQAEVSIAFLSLEEASRAHGFKLGRGGCCLRLDLAVPECTVDLNLRFTGDGLALEGQGIVRWYDEQTRRAGIEFVYLDPASRGWVLDRTRSPSLQSFIPA